MEDGVCSLSAERLATLLQEKAGELLMLDLRSFMSFNQCHLQSSINVCVPQALLKRKNFSLSCVESTIPCDKSREKFKNRQGSDIVLYDSDCEKVKKNCVLSALVQKLKDESLVNGVFFLHGGFQSFAQKFPQFCMSKDSPCSGVSHGFSLHLARPMLHLTPAHTPNNDITDKEPVQIFDYLFVGGEGVSSSLPTLEKYGITYVLNAAKECPDAHTADPRFTYLRLDLLDCATQDIDLALFERAFAFIDEAREKGQKILVHCKAGQSRSATIVISYIIRTHRWSLQQSYKFVQGKRPSVSPNLGFIAQLIRFENVVLGQSTSIQQLICSEPSSTTATTTTTTTTTTTQQPLPLTPIETSAPLASLVSIGCK